MTALRGLAALVFGLVVLLWPGFDVHVLALAFGTLALVDGLILAAVAMVGHDVLDQWWLVLVEGAVGIAVGAVALAWVTICGLSLLALLAAWAVITGVAEIEAGVRLRRLTGGEVSLLLAGGLSLLAGIALIALPSDDPMSARWAIGAFGLVYGALLVFVGARLYHLARVRRPDTPP